MQAYVWTNSCSLNVSNDIDQLDVDSRCVAFLVLKFLISVMARCCCKDIIGNLDLPAMIRFRACMLRTVIFAVRCSICRK